MSVGCECGVSLYECVQLYGDDVCFIYKAGRKPILVITNEISLELLLVIKLHNLKCETKIQNTRQM